MYTIEQLERRIVLARAAKLSGAELLENHERAMRMCNGIGAYWMPAGLRMAINRRYPELVVVADIHDIRHSIGGREFTRWESDFEFLCNGIRMAFYLRRLRVVLDAFCLWRILVFGSWTAFNYRRRGK